MAGFPSFANDLFCAEPLWVQALSIGRGELRLYYESLQHVLPTNRQGSA